MNIKQFLKDTVYGFWLIVRYGPHKISRWREESIIDPLTGLYNRRFLEESWKNETARARRAAHAGLDYPFSLVKIDIDKFKRINDTEGFLAGDEVLRRTASLLKKSCRESDIVCRLGGDEFAILLIQTGERGARSVISQLLIEAGDLFSPKGEPITFSCGCAEMFSLEETLKEADADMYRDKERSKVEA